MNSTVAIVHRNCPDGSAAAILVKKIFNDDIQVVHLTHDRVNYQFEKIVKKIPQNGSILFIDICCDKIFLDANLETIKNKNIYLGIYEHHESNQWLLEYKLLPNLMGEIIFDKNNAASKIFYKRFLKENPKLKDYEDFIEVINDRDIWINADPRGKELAKLHQFLGDNNFVERFLKNPALDYSEKEKYILEFEKEKENKHHSALFKKIEIKTDKDNFKYGVIYGEGSSSDLLNLAIEKFSLEYALLVNLNSKKVSIRSLGNFNCATYSEKYGGGGHRSAAGFRISFEHPQF